MMLNAKICGGRDTKMWCYQYTETKMIQNFGSLYIYHFTRYIDRGTPSECLTN